MTQQTYTPDWSKAPPQANWWARDKDGSGFWYSKRPITHRHSFIGYFAAPDNDCPFIDCSFELDNWRDTLTVRPFQDRDIPQNLSDYFAGKTPFITAYVDLLLARMAHTQSFSDDDDIVTFFEPFDVITFDDINQSKSYAIVLTSTLTPTGRITLSNYMVFEDKVKWTLYANEQFKSREYNFRTITELEAVEFRKAMEAVYG